jgi:hypothetical protein
MEAMVVLLLPNLSAYQHEESVVVALVSTIKHPMVEGIFEHALNMLSLVIDGVAPYG